jgi:hypothetical protein
MDGAAYTGHVIDGSTGKPAAGVYVIGRWDGGGGLVVSSSGCVIAVAVSDENGKFTLRGHDGLLGAILGPYNRPAIYLYKRGYQRRFPAELDEEPVVAVPDERPTVQRLNFVLDLESNTECGDIKTRAAKVRPLYNAILDEVRDLAKEKKLLLALDAALFNIDMLDMDYQAAVQRIYERRRAWGIE